MNLFLSQLLPYTVLIGLKYKVVLYNSITELFLGIVCYSQSPQ